ncbi:MAG: phosphohistidine phosphatase [Bradyrhizobium sp.]|jgi:phosphohistidine phosphatase
MRRLLLLRHAKTETDSPSGQDQDRRLDERGHRDAAEIGGWLAEHPPLPNRVLVSPAVRTKETWEIVRDAVNAAGPPPKVDFLPELYGADPTTLLTAIRMASVTDPKRLMLIGHNPGMHEVALTLTGSGDEAAKRALGDNLPTSGLAVFDFAIDDWNEVSFRRGKLVQFVSPKLLKQASRN